MAVLGIRTRPDWSFEEKTLILEKYPKFPSKQTSLYWNGKRLPRSTWQKWKKIKENKVKGLKAKDDKRYINKDRIQELKEKNQIHGLFCNDIPLRSKVKPLLFKAIKNTQINKSSGIIEDIERKVKKPRGLSNESQQKQEDEQNLENVKTLIRYKPTTMKRKNTIENIVNNNIKLDSDNDTFFDIANQIVDEKLNHAPTETIKNILGIGSKTDLLKSILD